MLKKICNGLAAAHKLNIVHRDIKADNIIIDEQNEPKILDFGLAKPVDPMFESSDNDNTDTADNDLTKAGKIIGTVTYMSPEQAKGEHVDIRSDIFSFGILLYRMATGEFPFSGPTQVSTIAKILETKHEAPRIKNSNISSELERIIDKCLQKNCEDRYQDTRDLVVDLRNLRRQYDSGFTDTISTELNKPETVTKSAELKLSKKPIWALAIVAAAVLVVLFVFVYPGFKSSNEVQAKSNSLAILGFENKTGDTELDWLQTGLPEILLTDLAQTQSLQLISLKRIIDFLPPEKRNNYTFDECVKAADKLGALHILSGSFYKLGEKIRIDARIIDAKSGDIVKTQKVIGSDPFELIDSLTSKIAIALNMQDEFKNDKSVSQYTSSPEAYKYYLEGMELFGLGRDELALEKFHSAIEADSAFAMPYMRIAMTSVFSGRQQKGIKYYQMAKDREESLPLREKTLLNVYTEIWLEQNFKNGYVKMESFVEQFPDDKEGQTIFGILVNAFNQDTTKAFEHLDKALEIDPAFHLALLQYAQMYINLKNYDEALKYAHKAKKYHPDSPDALRIIAVIQTRMGRLDDAIQTNLEVLDKFPENTNVLDNLYAMYIKKRDFNKARQYIEMIKRNHSDDNLLMSNYYYNMSNLSIWEGNLKQSFVYRKQAVAKAIDSNDSTSVSAAYNSLGRYNNYFDRDVEAIRNYQEGNKWYNSFQNFEYYLAVTAIDSSYAPKLRSEFIEVLEKFKTRVPSNLWYISDKMLELYDAGAVKDTVKGLTLLTEMYEQNPNTTSGRQIGQIEIELGYYQKGLDRILPFIEGERETSNAFTYLSLQYYAGYAYEHLGDTEEAINRYKEVLKYWGDADIKFKILTKTKDRLAKLTT